MEAKMHRLTWDSGKAHLSAALPNSYLRAFAFWHPPQIRVQLVMADHVLAWVNVPGIRSLSQVKAWMDEHCERSN